MQSKLVQNKARQTFYKNGTTPSSKQQIYVSKLLNLIPNYPVLNYSLDMVDLNENIYIEIDFGGHDLGVKLKSISEKEFNKKEVKRWYCLNKKGWKEIRIISKTDKLPSDSKILEIIQFAKDYLNEGHHYIRFDIDTSTVKTSQYEKHYDYGILRRITKKDLTLQVS